jgi:hypothetical protein
MREYHDFYRKMPPTAAALALSQNIVEPSSRAFTLEQLQ